MYGQQSLPIKVETESFKPLLSYHDVRLQADLDKELNKFSGCKKLIAQKRMAVMLFRGSWLQFNNAAVRDLFLVSAF
jgi:hypothetical protein